MTGVVVLDTNLLVLFVVGTASKNYIAKHKRLQDYNGDDFELLGEVVKEFSDLVLLPHILAEASALARQIDNPARARVQSVFRTLIATATELPLQSVHGVRREEFNQLGLTDAVILHFCTMTISGVSPTLITTDTDLANTAYSLGYSVIDYKQQYMAG